MATNNNSTSGIGFWGLLQIVFIGLKLTDVISWSWWVVLLPSEFGVVLVIFALIVLLLIKYAKSKTSKKN